MTKQQKLSPQKYIITKGKDLPFHECLINGNWEEEGMASVFISKKMPGGNFIVGLYMVDVYCLGLKNTLYQFNLKEIEYKDFLKKFTVHNVNPESCDLTFAHNLIYGAIDYAEELGFKPHKEFRITEYLLDTDLIDEGIDEIEFGKDGMPLYISGPDDNVNQIISTLDRTAGRGNYHFIAKREQFDEW